MVIVNPKLSLPSDLPYKKRQRSFNPNSQLQQATVHYNEAIRKQYNDIQFAKRFENGCISQNELGSVNTMDLVKEVNPLLFAEMSNINPQPPNCSKHRKFKQRLDISLGSHDNCGGTGTTYTSTCPPPVENAQTNMTMMTDTNANVTSPQYDCNNIEMFPPLSSTLEAQEVEKSNNITYFGRGPKHSKSSGHPPEFSNMLSLEVQAINEYQPTVDSAHDMIFGNVMGIDYGNYIHDRLWSNPQACSNNHNSCPQHFNIQHQQFHGHGMTPTIPIPCNISKSVGYNLPSMPLGSTRDNVHNENDETFRDVAQCAVSTGSSGSGRRSTSVPRPRAASRKETLKQAAIRCGIIKGNQTVPAIPKRSHYLVPLPLPSVQSDLLVPVVEILHPRALIPTCSSESLLDEMKNKIADAEFKKAGCTVRTKKSVLDVDLAKQTEYGQASTTSYEIDAIEK